MSFFASERILASFMDAVSNIPSAVWSIAFMASRAHLIFTLLSLTIVSMPAFMECMLLIPMNVSTASKTIMIPNPIPSRIPIFMFLKCICNSSLFFV
ncbi:MAG: hypothetical protein A4E61_01824 [Syntrophorhabdus sp. PtaB.Bin184]|nr:MAG: hypothetical protein A4E61_01824 [Syntrophorhabdus sp. PtaB.Bin184]